MPSASETLPLALNDDFCPPCRAQLSRDVCREGNLALARFGLSTPYFHLVDFSMGAIEMRARIVL